MLKKKIIKLVSILVILSFLITNVVIAGTNSVKKETVYVTLDTKGSVKSEIVTDWIHSDTPNVVIKDKSELENIMNLKGDETPQKQGEDLIWNLNGNDLFYQGTTDKELPFEVSIKYFLNGEETEPQDIAGKSGEVKIRIDVKNKQAKKVTVNGKTKKIYVPFAFAILVNLPQDKFTNVKANTGEIVTEGNTQAVVAILIPGLMKSLDLDSTQKENIKIPEYLEISSSCKEFELSSIYMLATNKLVDFGDLKEVVSLDDVKDALSTLYQSSQKILDGAVKLSEGQNEFCINFEKFNEGIQKLKNGSQMLYKGTSELKDGAQLLSNTSKMLQSGVEELYKSSQKINSGVSAYVDGVAKYTYGTSNFSDNAVKVIDGYSQLFAKNKELLDAVKKAMQGVDAVYSGQKELAENTKKLEDALDKILEGNKKELTVLNLVYSGFDTITSALEKLRAVPLVKDAVEPILAGISKQKEAIKGLIDSKNTMIAGLSQIISSMEKLQQGQEKLVSGLAQLSEAGSKINQSSDLIVQNQYILESAAAKLKNGKTALEVAQKELLRNGNDLKSGMQKYYVGFSKFESGFTQFASGVDKLKDGAMKLEAGFSEFDKNMKTVADASEKLYSGSKQVQEGLKTLNSSYVKFHKEGIAKLNSKANEAIDKIEDIKDTLEAMKDLSQEYKAFTGISKDMDGEVKFVLKTDEIKAKVTENNVAKSQLISTTSKKTEKKSFIKWLLGLLHISI